MTYLDSLQLSHPDRVSAQSTDVVIIMIKCLWQFLAVLHDTAAGHSRQDTGREKNILNTKARILTKALQKIEDIWILWKLTVIIVDPFMSHDYHDVAGEL